VPDEPASSHDDAEDDVPLPREPIVIPWRGHLVVAVLCVIFAIGAATTKGLMGIAIAVALLALAAVDIKSGLHKRKPAGG
jgi:hypothetical protein